MPTWQRQCPWSSLERSRAYHTYVGDRLATVVAADLHDGQGRPIGASREDIAIITLTALNRIASCIGSDHQEEIRFVAGAEYRLQSRTLPTVLKLDAEPSKAAATSSVCMSASSLVLKWTGVGNDGIWTGVAQACSE